MLVYPSKPGAQFHPPPLGITFLRKIKAAVDESGASALHFEQLAHDIPAEFVTRWTEEVELWEKDHRSKNPFDTEVKGG